MERIVVVGAGYAGLLCALRLSRKARGRAAVTLINARETFVERIRQHQGAAGQALRATPIAEFLRGSAVNFVCGAVTSIDFEKRQVLLASGAQPYDRLVLALGSVVDVDGVPGVREHAFTLDVAQVAPLAERLRRIAKDNGSVVVVGGGLTGIEAASEFAERYPSVRVTLLAAHPLATGFAPAAATHLYRMLAELGIVVRENVFVSAVERDAVTLVGGEKISNHACVWAGGFVAPALLHKSGLAVNERGQALVDPTLRSLSHPSVYLVGDAAAPSEPVGAPLQMSCKTAMPLGAHAADNLAREIAGEPPRPFNFGDSGVCISLGRKRALVQMHTRAGGVADKFYTGRVAVFFKELICRYTVFSLRLERSRLWGGYRWLHVERQLPTTQRKQLAA